MCCCLLGNANSLPFQLSRGSMKISGLPNCVLLLVTVPYKNNLVVNIYSLITNLLTKQHCFLFFLSCNVIDLYFSYVFHSSHTGIRSEMWFLENQVFYSLSKTIYKIAMETEKENIKDTRKNRCT